jgi:Holliday junction resolvasome RuvABC endonuclease subunit
MLTLGLDPSLRAFGFAIFDSSAKPNRRRIASGYEGTLTSTVPVARFIHFRSMVNDLIIKYNVDAVGIESPAYSGGPFSETHFGLMMFSLESVFEHRKDCVLFDPETLKLLAKIDPSKRKGKMNKLDMQKFVSFDTNDPKLINNNEADAYVCAKFTSRMIMLADNVIQPSDLTPSESIVFLERSKNRKLPSGKKLMKRIAHIFRENSRFFRFSSVPIGSVNLPDKRDINKNLLKFLELNEEAEIGV